MSRRTARIATAWSVALMQLLVCVGFASDVVLCVAADGHIALEIPHAAGPCLTDYDRHHPDSSHLDILDVEHHDCRDTLLSQPAAWRDEEKVSARTLKPAVAAAVSFLSPSPLVLKCSHEGPPSEATLATGRLAALRTVVLLI